MKKNSIKIMIIILVLNLITGCTLRGYEVDSGLNELVYEEIKDKLIRFHVIANSDSDEDQELKLKVRDKIIDEMVTKLDNVTSLDEAREVLTCNIDVVNNIAKDVLKNEGYNYEVKTMLSYENFPDKVYGEYIFPQGSYEAYRVVIGEGAGQNWWCVMFPPLCFVDESKSVVDSKKLDEDIDNIEKDKKEEKITYKFKILEVFKEIFN